MKRKKWIFALLMLGMLAWMPGMKTAQAEETVNIPDNYLKKAITMQLGKEEGAILTKSDMESLTTLSSDGLDYIESPTADKKEHNRGIESLEGLQYAVNLTSIDLGENRITDLTPIKELKQLSYLELDRNNLRNLEPISGLTSLEHLNIYNNFLESIEPLSRLTSLKWLDMHFANRDGVKIDHTPLAALTNLEYVSVESNFLTDLSFLEPLTVSGNLKTALVRANSITDFTVVKDLLTQQYMEKWPYGMPEFEEEQESSIMIGTNNQSPTKEIREVSAPADGGEVRIPMEQIKGFEGVEEYFADFAEMMEMDSLYEVALETSADQEGIEVAYDPDTNEAVFTFAENTIGQGKNFTTKLKMVLFGTDLEVQYPVKIKQPAKYGFDLSIADKEKTVLHIDTRNDKYVSSDFVTGTVTKSDGSQVTLEEVKIVFEGSCEWASDIPQSIFTAEDIQITGNQFRFRIGLDKEQAVNGNFTLKPTIQFQIKGDDEIYQPDPKVFKINNVYVSPTNPVSFGDLIVFDLAKGVDGTYQSEPFMINIPEDYREISWVTVEDSEGNRIPAVYNGDGTFTITVDKNGLKKTYAAQISLKKLQRIAPIQIRDLKTALVYGEKEENVEKEIAVSPVKIAVGETLPVSVTYQGNKRSEFAVVSGDTSILQTTEKNLTGVAEGRTTFTVSGLMILMDVEGEQMEVTYLPARETEIQVVKASGHTNEVKPDSKKPQSGTASVQTKDAAVPFRWLAVMLAAGIASVWILALKRRRSL